MSDFRLSATFKQNLQRLADGIEEAAIEAMRETVRLAEDDARALKRWRDPGTYLGVDRGGHLWEWSVTGQAAASITGYVVSNRGDGKKLPLLNPAIATTVTRDGVPFAPRTHSVDANIAPDHRADPGEVLGAVTMFVAYAPYLQKKEIQGSVWGLPSPGNPVTIEVFEVNWDRFYVPQVIKPIIEKAMRQVAAQLR